MATSTEIAIASQTLGSNTQTITFSSIPSTYTDLRLVFTGQGDNWARLQFNSDTATNYSCTAIMGVSPSVISARETSVAYITTNYPGYGLGTGQPLLITTNIFSYTGSTYKTALSTWSADYPSGGMVARSVGLWRSTATITSLKLDAGTGGLFTAGSVVTLYGIL